MSVDPHLDFALETATRALASARRYGLDASIAVVDRSGRLIVALRRDATAWASFDAAYKKACTAAALRMSTGSIAQMIADDPISLRALHANPDLLAVAGGFPLILDGVLVGGLGVAGGAWHDDEIVGSEAVAKE